MDLNGPSCIVPGGARRVPRRFYLISARVQPVRKIMERAVLAREVLFCLFELSVCLQNVYCSLCGSAWVPISHDAHHVPHKCKATNNGGSVYSADAPPSYLGNFEHAAVDQCSIDSPGATLTSVADVVLGRRALRGHNHRPANFV